MRFEFSGSLLRYVDYHRQFSTNASTLGGALEQLFARHPGLEPVLLSGERRFSRAHQLFVNGARLARGNEQDDDLLQTPVGPDDTVSILTLITGG
jgi:hypothetical protein